MLWREGEGRRWRVAACGAAIGALCAAAILLDSGSSHAPALSSGLPRVALLGEAEWGVRQAFATFAHNDEDGINGAAVQQAMEFAANETARRRERVCEFIGDMGDLLEEMSTERAVEMVRRLDEVQGDEAWAAMKNKLLAEEKSEAEEGPPDGEAEAADEEGAQAEGEEGTGESAAGKDAARRRRLLGATPETRATVRRHIKGAWATTLPARMGRQNAVQQALQEREDVAAGDTVDVVEADGGDGAGAGADGEQNATNAEEESKPLTARELLLAKFGCANIVRVPGYWGEWYFIGQMPAPLNEFGANGPATDVARMVPNVTNTSETVDFRDQEDINQVSDKIPPGAFAVKFTGDILIKIGGTYTFYATSYDGSRVFIDGNLIVDNSGYHGTQQKTGAVRLWAGYHSVVIDYFVGPAMDSFGKAQVTVQYSGPDTGGDVMVLPATHDEALQADSVTDTDVEVDYVPGWWGGYYFVGQYMAPVIATGASGPVVDVASLQPNVTSISADINFGSVGSFYALSDKFPRDPSASFAAKWIGNIQIHTPGLYTFSTTSDDGSRLWINNQMIVDNGGFHGSQKKSNQLHLTPGYHSIVADYFQARGGAVMVVTYSGADTNNRETLVKAVHDADLDNSTALQPIEPPEDPEWAEGFWGQFFYPPLGLGVNGPNVDVATLTPSLATAIPAVNQLAYVTSNDHSTISVTAQSVNPAAAFCSGTGGSVTSCDQCNTGECFSPAAALGNRDVASKACWNPQGAPPNYDDFHVILDAGQLVQVKAILWANSGDTIHDPAWMRVYASGDGGSWTQVAHLDMSALRGSKDEAVLPLPESLSRAARFWKLNPGGLQHQPVPRIMGVCDTPDCAAMPMLSGAWAVGEEPAEDFPVNGFAAKFMGSLQIQTAGWYTFYLSSRDGARLYVDDVKMVDSYATKGGFRKPSREMFLSAGYHALVADMWKAKDSAGEGTFLEPAIFRQSASVSLEYKGVDTYDEIRVVQGVHDPVLEEETPASGEATAAALRVATLMQKDRVELASAATRGKELAADVSRLRAQENQLRQREDLERSIGSLEERAAEALRAAPLAHSKALSAVARNGPLAKPKQLVLQAHQATARGRGVRGIGVREGVKKLVWPTYRDSGNYYDVVGGAVGSRGGEKSRSAVLDTERRWGWVKRSLEGRGTRARGVEGDGRNEGGEYEAGYAAGFRAVQRQARKGSDRVSGEEARPAVASALSAPATVPSPSLAVKPLHSRGTVGATDVHRTKQGIKTRSTAEEWREALTGHA